MSTPAVRGRAVVVDNPSSPLEEVIGPLQPTPRRTTSSTPTTQLALGGLRGLATTCLRFFNVYGPRQDPASPYSGVVAVFLGRALRGESLTVFGDGAQTRDLVYVEDVARAIVLACEPGRKGHVLCNIATGREVSVRALAELAQAAARACGKQPGPIVSADPTSTNNLGSHATFLCDERKTWTGLSRSPSAPS